MSSILFKSLHENENLLLSLVGPFWMVKAEIIQAQDPNFYIYLAFGQSNMEGAGVIESQDKIGVDARFQVNG